MPCTRPSSCSNFRACSGSRISARSAASLRPGCAPYEVVDTPNPRKAPKGKLPFIEDAGVRIADSSLIVDHLVRTRGVDPDARLDASQREVACSSCSARCTVSY